MATLFRLWSAVGRFFSLKSAFGKIANDDLARIKALGEELWDSPAVQMRIVECHSLKLVVEDDLEVRFRSIQTLAQLNSSQGVGPALVELSRIRRRWPNPEVLKWGPPLLGLLRKYAEGAFSEEE